MKLSLKDKPIYQEICKRVDMFVRRLEVAYILIPVGALQLFFLYLEFFASLPTGGFKPCREAGCVQRIPKIIHQTYKDDNIPPNWAGTPPAWKSVHPDWTYMFWTDEKNLQLIKDHYPEFLPTYLGYPYGIQRSDAARYFILHKYGGVYADLDIKPTRPVTEIIGDAELVLPQTPNFGLTNAFMASVNGSDFMAHIIDILPDHANKWYQIVRHWHIMTSAGPTFLWAQYERWTGDKSKDLIVPAAYWGKCSICKSRCRDIETSPLSHLTGNSWFSIDSFIFNYVIMCNPLPLAVGVLFFVDLYKTGRLPGTTKVVHSSRNHRSFGIKWLGFFTLAFVCYYIKQMP
mmetsp:Transcript_25256/g.49248  ORF Transcript_25256/g.49248 Transcript_25256/m.49248 type:complete len:345 (+) Transcript_25256:68-1102(+)